MFLLPLNPKFVKKFSVTKIPTKNNKKTMSNINKHATISFIANESGKVTNFQVNALRNFLKRFFKKKSKFFINISPTISITKKPNDVRQGRGKANAKYSIDLIRRGKLLFEINCFNAVFSKNFYDCAATKFTIKTHISDRKKR
jgi:large subunit ribosomal protein L16